jgi:molybdate transport system substrate-binding protein
MVIRTVAVALALLLPPVAMPDTALVAVAANFADVAEILARDYAKSSGHQVSLSSGSTGMLYARIVNAAPYDALLAADEERPRLLEESGDAVAGTRFVYAVGRLALWSADGDRIGKDGKAVLRAGDFRSLAMANPDLAPYGAAARETLQALGLWDKLQYRIVMGENIGQTFSLVATGNADLGFVALASIRGGRSDVTGSTWIVPADLHSPIRQDAVLLAHGAGNAAAAGFLAYLQTDAAKQVIELLGYGLE